MKQQIMCLLLCFSLLFMSTIPMGCAGREANPIPAYLPGDENLSCRTLAVEMAQIQTDMDRLRPKTNKAGTNILWGIAGVLLIFPFFFMDFKDAEKIEYDALDRRRDHLMVLATEKNCDLHMINVETISAKTEVLSEVEVTMINCANCDEPIGKLEIPKMYDGQVVCAKCYAKLTIPPRL
ncbi:MAG: hypothetical protein ACYSUK_01300 [Planctomycetota bacterium]|jgi:hypothetical protein